MKEDFKANVLEFEKLKIEEKEVARKIKVLKEAILPHMNPGDKIIASKGAVEMRSKTVSYSYSEETTLMEAKLEEKRKEEIATGKATPNVITFLEYRVSKRSNEDEDA